MMTTTQQNELKQKAIEYDDVFLFVADNNRIVDGWTTTREIAQLYYESQTVED